MSKSAKPPMTPRQMKDTAERQWVSGKITPQKRDEMIAKAKSSVPVRK